MSPTPLTREQLLARDTRDVSIGVSAGAGCGKTHVLTSRFLSHLESTPGSDVDPAELRQLIAITFTDAAAREMRSRIRKECYAKLDDETLCHDVRPAWQKLLREIDTARVSTIHAFCTALLRTHAAEAGLDPTFAVMEQGEADVLHQEVIDDVLRDRLAAHDAATLDLAAEFGQLSQLKERVSLLIDQRHRPEFGKWLASSDDQPAKASEMVAIWKTRYERDKFKMKLDQVLEKAPIAEFARQIKLAAANGNPKLVAAAATLTEIVDRLQNHPGRITDGDLDTLVANARVSGICKKDDWADPHDYDLYGDVCEKIRKVVKSSEPKPWSDDVAQRTALVGQATLSLAGDVAGEYQRRKMQQAKLDFTDQLALTHRLLGDPEKKAICQSLSADLRLLLVDEFQDTDPLQVELIKMICGPGFDEGRLFFVGDFKQSIYRFRGAVPPEFLKLRSEVPESGRLKLTENFRSQPGVLHFVNALFHDSFDKYEALVPHRAAATGAPAVEFLWTVPQPKPGLTKVNAEEARQQEAAAIARRLRQLMDESCAETPVVDKETMQPRPLRPGDVAILFRALSDVRLYEEALRDQGLEYYLVGGHAFYAQQEIFDVLNLLRAVASAADEISLAGVLRSPFFSLADESLFWLVESGGSLNAGLFADSLPSELPADEVPKVAAAARTLGRLRAVKDYAPITALLNEALDLTGYDAVVVAEFLGERKLANLHKLVEQARTADQNNLDLSEFITQLNEFVNQPPKEPLASTSAEAGDVIRLMTIHRAKGLEFPFVVNPDMNRPPQLDGPNAALDDELGPLVRMPKDDAEDEAVTGMTLFVAAERTAELEERKRLLYVACTRAADYLLLSTSIESVEQPKSDWMKLLASHFDLASGEYGGSPLPNENGYEEPRVHIAPPAAELKAASRSRGVDLLRVLNEAHQLAAEGRCLVPQAIAPVVVDRADRRQFSFSRLSGRLVTGAKETPGGVGGYQAAPIAELSAILDPSPDARGLGSLTHDVLARIDFASPRLEDEAAEWCEHLAPQYVVHQAESAAKLAAKMIARFAASPRWWQLAAANTVHREIEFLLPWPPDDANGDRYVRKFIDCLYENGGVWRIVDYKTNDVRPANAEHVAKQYEMQLYVYAMAAEQALGKSPTELVLELLRPGIEHKIAWNDAVRQQAIKMVNEAIDAAPLDPEPRAPSPEPLAPSP